MLNRSRFGTLALIVATAAATLSCASIAMQKAEQKQPQPQSVVNPAEAFYDYFESRDIETAAILRRQTVDILCGYDTDNKPNAKRTYTWGSGVTVNAGDATYVWTNAHVIYNLFPSPDAEDLPESIIIVAFIPDAASNQLIKHMATADVVAISAGKTRSTGALEEPDLALLRVDHGGEGVWVTDSARFWSGQPPVGAKVVHAGNYDGLGGAPLVSWGRIGGHNVKQDGIDFANLMIVGGSSGGGIFLDKNRFCVGLVTKHLFSASLGAETLSSASAGYTSFRQMHDFAIQHNIEYALPRGTP